MCAAGLSGSHGRRRGQGGGDLPGPQGHADRDRRPRATSASPPRGDDRRAAGRPGARRSCCRRWSATCSATRRRWRSTPRPARCARRARPIEHGRRPRRSRGDDVLAPAARRASAPPAERFLDGLRSRPVRRPPRGEHRGAPGRAAARRASRPAARGATRPSPARSARRASLDRRPRRRARRARSRSSPGRSTPSSTRPRRSPSASPAATRACSTAPLVQAVLAAGAGRDRLTLPHAEGARRPRSGRRRGRRASPATGIDGESIVDRRPRRSSTAASCRCSRGRATTRSCAAPSTASPPSARCSWPAGRNDGRTRDLRARGEGRHVHRASRCCTCASTTACRRRRCAACCRATTAATTASSTG